MSTDLTKLDATGVRRKDYSQSERKIVALLESKSKKFWICIMIIGVAMSFLAKYLSH